MAFKYWRKYAIFIVLLLGSKNANSNTMHNKVQKTRRILGDSKISSTMAYLEVIHCSTLTPQDSDILLTNGTLHPYPYFASLITVALCLVLLIILFRFAPQLADSGQ